MDGELYDLYMLGDADEVRRQALVDALRKRSAGQQQTADMAGAFGNLGMLTGDKVLGGFGQAQLGRAERMRGQNQVTLQNALTALREGKQLAAQQRHQRAMEGIQRAQLEQGKFVQGPLGVLNTKTGALQRFEEPADPSKANKAEDDLRKEFMGMPITKETVAMRSALQGINTALAQNTAAGDMAGIFQFMKVLDPSSSVREGEYANAKNSAGVPDQIRNLYNQALTGKLLNPAQRKDFMNTAAQRYKAQRTVFDQFAGGYRQRAHERGVDPGRVVFGFDDEAAPAPKSGDFDLDGPPEPKSQAEYDALPPGSVYLYKGQPKRKPGGPQGE